MAFFVTGAVIAGGAGLISAGIGAVGANMAANKQADAANNALAFQKQAYADSQPRFAAATTALNAAGANYQPYLDIGKGATYTLGQLTGSNGGGGNQPDYSSFFKDPSYTFTQQQGELGIERGANARGMNLSGGTLKDLATFNSGLASQQYGNYFNRLMGLSQLGQNAAGGAANVAGNIGNLATGQANANNAASTAIGNTTQAVGQAQASGIVGGANAITGGINNGVQNSLLAGYMGRQNPSGYSADSYGGGNALTDAWGGSSRNPLQGLSPSDYGSGY